MKRAILISASLALGMTGAARAEGITAKFVQAPDAAFETPDPNNPLWAGQKAETITLLGQAITTPSKFAAGVSAVDVRAAHNGKWLAVQLTWKDAVKNEITNSGRFPDGAAMSIPTKDPTVTSPFMGNVGAGVMINYWKALWQRDVDKGYQDVHDIYPNTQVDGYYLHYGQKDNSAQAALATTEKRQSLPAFSQGSPMAQLNRRYPVEQLLAEGFGSLTNQKRQDARGNGSHQNGQWTVVFTQPLITGDPADAELRPGAASVINFAIWDGEQGDAGARKNYSMFTPLTLEKLP